MVVRRRRRGKSGKKAKEEEIWENQKERGKTSSEVTWHMGLLLLSLLQVEIKMLPHEIFSPLCTTKVEGSNFLRFSHQCHNADSKSQRAGSSIGKTICLNIIDRLDTSVAERKPKVME